ncbi:MAG: acyl-CoA thioesterase [Mycobacterium sp.]|nr:acyl-CoA thioesterase [Mycobacterium sp.]
MIEWTTVAARPDPRRLQLDCYPVIDEIAARYGDMDANAHLNNVALDAMHENARATMSRGLRDSGLFDRGLRLVTAQRTTHFLAEAHWPAMIRTGSGAGHVGRTSYVASTGLFRDGICISVCDAVTVLLDDDGPTPIPDDFRAALQTVLLDSPRST